MKLKHIYILARIPNLISTVYIVVMKGYYDTDGSLTILVVDGWNTRCFLLRYCGCCSLIGYWW